MEHRKHSVVVFNALPPDALELLFAKYLCAREWGVLIHVCRRALPDVMEVSFTFSPIFFTLPLE
jgi:hypothetical protein